MLTEMRIGVCGIGFVGSAMRQSFEEKGVENITVYDKYKMGGIGDFESLLDTDITFLALPTIFDTKMGAYDLAPLEETLNRFSNADFSGAIVIKSTIEPQSTDRLAKKYGLNLIHNPEFLTAKTAFADFHNQDHIVLGKSESCADGRYKDVINFYQQFYPDARLSLCSATESESMKIFVNSFYATKIQFFNELYLLCQKINIDYNTVKNLMLNNRWITEHHTSVPGPDGRLSYGGLCFPKDTNALLNFMRREGVPHRVLDAVVNERNEQRNDHDNIRLD